MRRKSASAGLVAAAAAVAGVALAAPATAAPLDASGCNGLTEIVVIGPASGWTIAGHACAPEEEFTGHIQVIAPGLNRNGPDGFPAHFQVSGHGAGQACVIGWRLNSNGTYTKVGEPCETIS